MPKIKTLINFDKIIKKQKNLTLKVGFPNTSTSHSKKDGVTALEKAIENEFGTSKIPARPFMSQNLSLNKEKYKAFLDKIDLRKDSSLLLNQLGFIVVSDIQKSINSGNFKENSKLTVKLKGSSKPLVDTGHMKQSVNFILE